MPSKLEELKQKLFAEKDGVKFDRIKNKLIKQFAESDRKDLLLTLIQYVKEGGILHWRNYLLNDIIPLVENDEQEFADFFEWGLSQSELSYWSIDGYLKTKGKQAYPKLVRMALDETVDTVTRAKAIKSLAMFSKQPFDNKLPTDPGYWKKKDFKLEEIKSWQRDGYPDSSGYAIPKTDPALVNPITPLEQAAAKLEKKLAKYRAKDQDLSQPSNWLQLADEKSMEALTRKWTLPANYEQFLRRFSPLLVTIFNKRFFQGLALFGAKELLDAQAGYAFNGLSGEILPEWPKGYLVIANDAGDPYCLDLEQITGDDAPVYTAEHGTGTWDFEKYSDSFLDFLQSIGR